jgi:hypothetical protein
VTFVLTVPTSKLRLHERADEIPTIPPDEYDELLEDIEKREAMTGDLWTEVHGTVVEGLPLHE